MLEQLLETYHLNTIKKRTKYEDIIQNLEHVFDSQDICYEFSEQLFSQEGLDRVTKHLGISNLIVDTDSPNPSPKSTVIPNHIKIEIINFYKDTYLYVFNKFRDNVPISWRKSFNLL